MKVHIIYGPNNSRSSVEYAPGELPFSEILFCFHCGDVYAKRIGSPDSFWIASAYSCRNCYPLRGQLPSDGDGGFITSLLDDITQIPLEVYLYEL